MGNIMVANDDPSRIVGVVDWEGARVVPLWASYFSTPFLGKGMYVGDDPDLLDRLLDIRRKIHVSMQPALEHVEEATSGLRALWYIANRPSMFHEPLNVLGAMEHFLWSRPQDNARLFDRVIQFGYGYVMDGRSDESMD
ncbi:hypothetical protein OF83DRAFT_1192063 [Amylostereum chailletii]|nr:hypothetical protein OF83DRAFT_1192063 [Amylostereum chailletii]